MYVKENNSILISNMASMNTKYIDYIGKSSKVIYGLKITNGAFSVQICRQFELAINTVFSLEFKKFKEI